MIQWMLALWSLVPLPFLNLVEHLQIHSSHTVEAWLGEFWALFASVWDECNCVVVWTFFGIVFLWDWNENWPFPGRDWWWGKLGLSMAGWALLSEALIQLSADGWGCTPLQLFALRWPSPGIYRLVNGELQEGLCQGGPSWLDADAASAPIPVGEPLPALAPSGDPPTLAGSFGSVACGVTAPFLWVLVHTGFWLCLQKCSLCFPQCCGIPVIKFHWPSRPDSLGISSPFVRSLGWEAWHGVLNFQNSGKTSLVLLFSIFQFIHLASIGC